MIVNKTVWNNITSEDLKKLIEEYNKTSKHKLYIWPDGTVNTSASNPRVNVIFNLNVKPAPYDRVFLMSEEEKISEIKNNNLEGFNKSNIAIENGKEVIVY